MLRRNVYNLSGWHASGALVRRCIDLSNPLSTSILLVVIVMLGLFHPAHANESLERLDSSPSAADATNTIESLSNRILAKQLEFLRLGLRLKHRGESKNLWRNRRQSFFAFTNSSLTSIGAFMAATGRLKYASHPEDAPNKIFENATIVRLLANSISIGGVLLEVGNDSIGVYKDHKAKLNLRGIGNQADEIQQEVISLVKQRAEALAKIQQPDLKRLYQLEEKVLADVHEAALEELGAFYSEAQGKRARRITQLSIIFTSNFVSGGGSLYSGIIVPHQFKNDPVRRTRYGGVGGITDIATGSANIMMPLLASGSEMVKRRSAKKVLFKQLGSPNSQDIKQLKKDEETLRAAVSSSDPAISEGFEARRKVIASFLSVLKRHQEISERERRHAIQKMIVNVLDSGADASGGFSKVVNGIGGAVGAYRYTFDANKRFRVQGGTNLAYGIGNAIAVEEVVRGQIQLERKHAKDEQKHELLTQIMDDEIAQIEDAQRLLLAAD
ncbi:hypothetical protein KF913_12565 [Candidatus Obscuribacterales bacterium]|nr:hypothetical protein [Candidatus Obscuribacterales bacterium]